MRSLSLVLGFALVLAASAARPQVVVSPPAGSPLPKTALDACKVGCIGYSPSTRAWLCPFVTGSGRRTALTGEESMVCSLQLIRERSVLADLVMYVMNPLPRERPDLALPFEQVLTIAPPDLAPVTVHELLPGRELPLPNTRHVLRLDLAATSKPTPGGHLTLTLNLLCNRNREVAPPAGPPANPRNHAPIPNLRTPPLPAKRNEVALFKSRCHVIDVFRIVFGPDPTQIGVIEISSMYCDDFASDSDRRQVYGIDLGKSCTASASEGRSPRP